MSDIDLLDFCRDLFVLHEVNDQAFVLSLFLTLLFWCFGSLLIRLEK